MTVRPGMPPRLDSAALLDGLGDAVVIADLAGAIVYVNPAACSLLGVSMEELVGGPLVRIIPERLRSAHAAGWERYFRTRAARLVGRRPARLPVLRGDGSELEIDLALSVHTTDDDTDVVLAVLRGLGDRIELERQRRITTYLATSREIMARLALEATTAVSLDQVAPVLLEALGEGLRWDGGAVWAVGERTLDPVARWPETVDSVGRMMTDGVVIGCREGLAGRVADAGGPKWIETVADETLFRRRAEAERAGVRSCFAFPIVVAGDVLGVVEMYSRAEYGPEPELLAVLEAAGLEIGRYLERAQSRRHLVEMAEALQASLLPPRAPVVPGLDIAVRYRAASGEGQVGGDFFDVFPLPDGQWAVFIGDERFLTVAYLTVSPSPGGFEVTVACGGHPYPLARRADGTVEEVHCEGDLIGSFAVHESRDETIGLRAEDVLVLVTDGVIEARAGRDEFGEDRLRATIAASATESASDLADAIQAAVLDHLGGHAQDDFAIVVLRLPESEVATVDVQVAEVDAALS